MFVQVSITLKVKGAEIERNISALKPDIFHRVNILLESKRFSELSTADGKKKLANEIQKQVEDVLGKAGVVSEVLFNTFVMQ